MSDHEHQHGHGHRHGQCQAGLHVLTCKEISEFLLAYLDRELDPLEQAEFERHLKGCPPCHNYLDGYKETVELVKRCGKAEIDPETKAKWKPPEDLVQAILRAKATSGEPG